MINNFGIKIYSLKNDYGIITISFPEKYIPKEYIDKLIKLIKMEERIENNQMTEEDIFQLSEEIKTSYWKKNQGWILKKINDYKG